MKAFGPGIAMQRLTATVHGWPRGGQERWNRFISGLPVPSVSRSAPRPTMPAPDQPERGRADRCRAAAFPGSPAPD
jgi:hypothetical protein